MSLRPAVFFDRDGTLMEEAGYCADPREVRVYPGVPAALRELKAAGFLTFIVTNQSGIGRGFFTEAQYQAVQARLLAEIGPGLIDASYYCPDAPGVPSSCRKPERSSRPRAISRSTCRVLTLLATNPPTSNVAAAPARARSWS
jgi:D-glycero-D-manno-heptose 1,7-bisphosphate phosphatase